MLEHERIMKTLLAAIIAGALTAVLAIPLCVSAQGTDPESVVRALMDAMNTQDMEAGMALITDDAVVTLLPPPARVFTGRKEIRAYWEAWFSVNGYVDLKNFQVNGDKATWEGDVWSDKYRDLGIAPMAMIGEGIVQDGLLKSWTFTKPEESIAKEEAAVAAQAAASALPEAGIPVGRSGLPSSSYALVAALGGLMLLGGLGLARLLRRIV
jgi:hypothetical protein